MVWRTLYCLATGEVLPGPKSQKYAPWKIVLKGAERVPGAYFAVIGRRKSDLLILKDAAERDGSKRWRTLYMKSRLLSTS